MTASGSRIRARSVAATLVVAATGALAASACSSGSDSDSGASSIEARMLPPLSDPGASVRSADDAEVVVEGTVAPVSEGAKVTLQVRDGSSWTDLGDAKQDSDGYVELTAPYLKDGQAQTYRLVAGDDVVSEKLDTGQWVEKIEFDDQFTDDALGPWWTLREQDYGLIEGRSCSKSELDMVTVAGGVASLGVAVDPDKAGRCSYDGSDYGYRLNSNIGTVTGFTFTSGVAAARMKFHRDRGQHAAFWLQPAPLADPPPAGAGPDKAGAEIDVVEWFGDDHPSGGLAHYVYYNDEDGKGVKAGGWVEDPEKYGDDWWKKYHVFSVEWSPDGYVFRIDGKVSARLDEGSSGVPEYLILSNLSSNYELPHLPSEDDLPQATKVDWVRVWSR